MTERASNQPKRRRRRIVRVRLTRDLRTYADIAAENLIGLPTYGGSAK